MEIALAVLLVLSFPVIAIAGLVIAIGARDRVRLLEAQFAAFRNATPDIRAAAATPAPAAAPTPQPQPRETAEPRPIAPAPAEPVPPSRAAAATSVPPTQPPSPPPPSAPSEPAMGLEERLGTQWTVWVGGVALALGGYFLVRYSIEQGWFGPGMRVFLGGILALALIGAGEWARRKENLSNIGSLPSAHIPSILTAAGTAVAYADVWAAYELYKFIGPATAFILLGIVALATLAAALVHGPSLAGLGLVGAYVTPLLVSTERPNFWALYVFIAVVTAAAFMLARARMWRWLAVTAVAFGLFWTLPGLNIIHVGFLGAGPHSFHAAAGFALVATFIVSGLLFGPNAEPGRIDPVSSGALAAYLVAITLVVLASRHDALALIVFTALIGATIAIAWRTEAAMAAVPVAAAAVAVMFLQFAVNITWEQLVLPSGPTAGAIPEPQRVFYGTHLTLGALFAALFGGAGFLAQGRSTRSEVPTIWATCAVFVPIAILVALYYRIYSFEQSVPFAGLALVLAALFAVATEMLGRREPRPGIAAATAIFATGAVAALALALTMALEKGWLTIALALMVPGIAFVADKRPLPGLRILVGVLVAAVLARVALNPAIVTNVGTTPVFNWLLWGYGVPAVAFWLGGYILRRRADDVPARMADAAALLFGVLLVFLEVRHYATGGNLFRPVSTLLEIALHVNVWLAMAIGFEWLRERSGSMIHNVGAIILTVLAMIGIVFGLGIGGNPMIWSTNVGGAFFNLILLGYGMPAVLTAALALTVRVRRPMGYSPILAIVAVALALAYLSLQVRRVFHGPVLTVGPTTDAEQYTYSVIWLAFGVVLLAVGILLKSQAVRLASAAVVILTVLKVFFVDMRDLTGIWQSISLIGLGVVLMGIGVFYQRLLFPRRLKPVPAQAPVPS